MDIKRIFRLLGEISYLKSTLRRYGDSLLPGRYHLFRTMRSLSHADEKTMSAARPYFDKNKDAAGKLTGLIHRLNRQGYFSNRSRRTSGEYEAIYTANNYDRVREVKLFSFKGKKILTIPVSTEARDAALSEYQTLSPIYPMPPVRATALYENAYEIAMISLLPRPAEPAALAAIAACAARVTAASEGISVKELCNCTYGKEMDAMLAPLVTAVHEIFRGTDAFALSPQHGDLSRDNLLYGVAGDRIDFFWIDWEHLGDRLFFYDYFFYILNTAVYGKDFCPLEAYLCGECDGHLAALFQHFGTEYDPSKRAGYFLLFAIAFLRERVCDRGNLSALRMYCEFIGNRFLMQGKDSV